MSQTDPKDWSLNDLMFYPWTYIGPTESREDDDEPYFEMRIEELEDFFLAARTREQLLKELKPALKAFLRSFLDYGDCLPALPPAEASWVFSSKGPSRPRPPQPTPHVPQQSDAPKSGATDEAALLNLVMA